MSQKFLPTLSTHPKYRPDIDGLRAIAVFLVIVFHLFPNRLAGGFIGVDIFFVISGFLISSIIFSGLDLDKFSFVDFYSRRIRRIFPAFLLVLLASSAFGWYVLFIHEHVQLGKHIIGSTTFISNFVLLSESGYFDSSADTKPLLHLWSLAIEEQFYLLWPLLMALAKRCNWKFWPTIVVVGMASLTVSIYLVDRHPNAAFYSPISRFWELTIGSFLAYLYLYQQKILQRHHNIQSFGGAALILLGLLTIDKTTNFPGWWAMLPTVGTFLLISAGPRAWLNQKILSNSILVWFGLISYPLYLWHWPLLAYAHILVDHPLSTLLKISILLSSIGLAWMTYQFIEKPLRSSQNQKSILCPIAILLLFLGYGVLTNTNTVMPRHSSSDLQVVAAAVGDWQYHKNRGGVQVMNNAPEGVYFLPGKTGDTTLYLGDSHLEQYIPRVLAVAENNPAKANSAIFATAPGCPPAPGIFRKNPMSKYCPDVIAYGAKLAQQESVKKIVIGGCWNCYFTDAATPPAMGMEESYVLDRGQKRNFRESRGLEMGFANLEQFLRQLSKNKVLYIILDTPQDERFDPKNFLAGSRLGQIQARSDYAKPILRNASQIQLSKKLTEMAKRNNFQILDPVDILCAKDSCSPVQDDGRPIYLDRQHLRPFFVTEKASFMDRTLVRD
jgi:peptidoglycan/LPS O-acetylase OafA/YrhL